MQTDRLPSGEAVRFELNYRSLRDADRGLVFPCDAQGQVELDRLSDRERANYLYARVVVGIELAATVVRDGAMRG